MKNLSYYVISLIVVLFDQVSKIAVRYFFSTKAGTNSVQVIGDFFRLTLAQNTGAAFSFAPGSELFNRIFFIAIKIIASVVLVIMIPKTKSRTQKLAFALILGGAIGNLIDRILIGSVTDFLDFDFPDFIMQRWAIFNIADSAIVVAVILFIVYTLFFEKRSKKLGG